MFLVVSTHNFQDLIDNAGIWWPYQVPDIPAVYFLKTQHNQNRVIDFLNNPLAIQNHHGCPNWVDDISVFIHFYTNKRAANAAGKEIFCCLFNWSAWKLFYFTKSDRFLIHNYRSVSFQNIQNCVLNVSQNINSVRYSVVGKVSSNRISSTMISVTC